MITLRFFKRSTVYLTIDPKKSGNAVYGADIWSPTQAQAQVEREVSSSGVRKFDELIRSLSKNVSGGIFGKGWGLPVESIVTTISAVCAFLGAVLGFSTAQYNAEKAQKSDNISDNTFTI